MDFTAEPIFTIESQSIRFSRQRSKIDKQNTLFASKDEDKDCEINLLGSM
jgi:hypothetical protein